MKTIAELAKAIEEESGLDISQLPQIGRFVWHARRTPVEVSLLFPLAQTAADQQELLDSMNPTVWKVNDVVPFSSGMLVFAIFEDVDEARVYAVPVDQSAGKNSGPPTLYRLSKLGSAGIWSQQTMTEDAFKTAIANEWLAVDQDARTPEDEREDVIAYIGDLPDNYPVKQLMRDLAEEAHLDGDDDEEDEEPEKVQNGAVASAPSPVENLLRENAS